MNLGKNYTVDGLNRSIAGATAERDAKVESLRKQYKILEEKWSPI
jgi:hypothetical protein